MLYMVDIDGTICTLREKGDYENAEPLSSAIEVVNGLRQRGNTIIYWTSRGYVTGKNWRSVTVQQFKQWGVKYDALRFDKPVFDFYVDSDKAVQIKDIGG